VQKGQAFLKKAKVKPPWVQESIVLYMDSQKQRFRNGELAAITLKNFYQPIKVFCEMHDLAKLVNWKRITRGFPKGRSASNDRVPTIEETRKLVEYSDIRIKSLLELFATCPASDFICSSF
jgi:hypothetical protein